ncbi:MAG: cobalamin-binding protein [Candidatus Omnitrophica bacterium]|nr:cobalamin-binding protein [Candidatus Omnitrophota bacterium]MDD5237591.1 cobalamin-binding protein [Candidatus Omnitrophota bacterium]
MKKILLVISTVLLIFLGTVPLGLQQIILAGTVPNKPRYISLAPSTTEILFALGLEEEIVGVSSYCNYPLQVKTKEKVGSFSQPNIEKIVSLKPDYIFCTGLEQAQVIAQLKRLNLKVYVADPKNIKELFNSILQIGRITNRYNTAQALIAHMQKEIEKISAKVNLIPQKEKLKVFIEVWYAPLTTAGKGSFINELITLAGGINIASDTKRPYTIFSAEQVIKRNPDCIILAYMDKEKPVKLLEKRLGWNGISAVRNKRVYNDINPDLLLRPSPRITEGLKEIYQRLYL